MRTLVFFETDPEDDNASKRFPFKRPRKSILRLPPTKYVDTIPGLGPRFSLNVHCRDVNEVLEVSVHTRSCTRRQPDASLKVPKFFCFSRLAEQASPAARLSTEVLAMIFLELQRSLLCKYIWNFDINRYFSWTAVLGVCRDWRAAALSSAELWGTIASAYWEIFGFAMKKGIYEDSMLQRTLVAKPTRIFFGLNGPHQILMDLLKPCTSRI